MLFQLHSVTTTVDITWPQNLHVWHNTLGLLRALFFAFLITPRSDHSSNQQGLIDKEMGFKYIEMLNKFYAFSDIFAQ